MTNDFKVKCPYCKKEFIYKDSKFRPFCCQRCKMIDLGQWLSENYQIESKEKPGAQETDEQDDE